MAKSAFGGAIEHSGDNLTGEGEGDDEVITVDLGRLPADAHALVFTVNSFRGQKFTDVPRPTAGCWTSRPAPSWCATTSTDAERSTGVIMSVLVRSGPAWDMTAIGEFHDGKTARAMYEPAEQVVRGLVVDVRPAACHGRTMAEETIFTWGAPPLKFGAGAADEIGFEMAGLRRAAGADRHRSRGERARRAAADRRRAARATTSRPRSSTACTSSRPTTR